MNERVRTYLIEAARQKDKFVFYSDVVKDCGLNINTNTEYGRKQLSNILGEVSAFENSHKRPLVSSLAIYKDKARNDHGDGFYKLAEQLGKGKFSKLREDLYGFMEAEECRKYWQNEDNYSRYFKLHITPSAVSDISFFNIEELDFFTKWQLLPYDKDDIAHVNAKNQIMDTVWEKSIYLINLLLQRLPDFESEGKKIWHKLGSKEEGNKRVHAMQFKHYTWVKVFRIADAGKQIYFTFGLDAHPETQAFVYKLDCQRERGSVLSDSQIALCDSLIPASAEFNRIPFEDLLKMNWGSLTEQCLSFVNYHLSYYDAIVKAVWGKPIPSALYKNQLIKQDKPKGGFETIPESKRTFEEVDVDFQGKAKTQKDLGDAGEALVKKREIEYLEKKGLHDKVELVHIVKDGKGYDVLSFDENGNEKFIEVKTTEGGEYVPFYLSSNEIDFMRLNPTQYCIYRVYNYDEENNFGEFFELIGDIESQLLMKPTLFKVLIKKEA